MSNNEFMDVRCILLCKAFQANNNPYNLLSQSLKKQWGKSLTQYHTFGEYDKIYSFQIENSKQNLFKNIEENNQILTSCVSDSVFFKTLYLLYPMYGNYTQETENFWSVDEPFFFVSVIHTNHCSTDPDITKKGREHIISKIDNVKKITDKNDKTKYEFKYRVYHSLDLSDYIIVWKTKEPSHVLFAIQYLYEYSELIGYSNTIYGLPFSCFDNLETTKNTVGKTPVSMLIQAVTQSYKKACEMHKNIETVLKKDNPVSSYPTFSLGSDDYLGFYQKVYPSALYDFFSALINEERSEEAIASLNAVLSIEAYSCTSTEEQSNELFVNEFQPALSIKTELKKICHQIKNQCLLIFNEKPNVFNKFYWRKTLTELLVLLDNMSKSAVFDSACFLLLDSIHLFLSFIEYQKKKCVTDEDLICVLNEREKQIETFIREWEQLTNHVVQIDGAFQKTPGYEPLNYNMSENVIEFYNAFAQKTILYFSLFDENYRNQEIAHPSSFVVPKLCRKFKTAQWFCDNRGYDSLLFITIPISQMFETSSNMIALTHEISHYCSNCIRVRERRKENFLLALASLLCSKLGLKSNNTINAAYKTLMTYFEAEKNGYEECYLSDLSCISKKIVFKLLDKTEDLNKLFVIYKNENKIEDIAHLAVQVKRESVHLLGMPKFTNQTNQEYKTSIYDLIDDMLVLFKECYADMMMIYLLSLSPENYLNESFNDLKLLDVNTEYKKVYSKYQRVLIVCEALVATGFWERTTFFNAHIDVNKIKVEQQAFSKEFLNVYFQWINDEYNNQDYSKFLFNKDILWPVIRYLQCCMRAIKNNETDETKNVKKEILEIFNTMSFSSEYNQFSDKFQTLLQENRLNVIKKWQNRENSPYTFGEV